MFIGGWLEVDYQRRKADVPESLQNFYNMWREDGWDAPGNYHTFPWLFSPVLFTIYYTFFLHPHAVY